MTNESALLALLESREAEANAKAEWIAEWVANNRPLLMSGMLGTDPATLLCELNNNDQHRQYNQAIWLLMNDGDHSHLVQFIQQVVDAGLSDLAHDAWSNDLAELQTAMSDEQWEQYQHRSAA